MVLTLQKEDKKVQIKNGNILGFVKNPVQSEKALTINLIKL